MLGGAELGGELLPGLVPAHRDHPLGAQLGGGEHAAQPDRAVADHGDGHAGLDAGGDGGEPTGGHHVGQGQQARDEVLRRLSGVATRVPSASGMRMSSAWQPS